MCHHNRESMDGCGDVLHVVKQKMREFIAVMMMGSEEKRYLKILTSTLYMINSYLVYR
jgi:hypothetical protein